MKTHVIIKCRSTRKQKQKIGSYLENHISTCLCASDIKPGVAQTSRHFDIFRINCILMQSWYNDIYMGPRYWSSVESIMSSREDNIFIINKKS